MRLLEKPGWKTEPVICLLLLSFVIFLSFSQVPGESFLRTSETSSPEENLNPISFPIEPDNEMIWEGEITFQRYADIEKYGVVGMGTGRCSRKINCEFRIDSRLHSIRDMSNQPVVKNIGDSVSLFTLSAELINEIFGSPAERILVSRKIPEFKNKIISVYNPYREFNDGVELRINKESMTYELIVSLSLSFQKKGASTFYFMGGHSIDGPRDLNLEIGKIFQGQTDGQVISGSWNTPECRLNSFDECWISQSKTPDIFGGGECGSTWEWNFRRIK